jgi:hypothetical protein
MMSVCIKRKHLPCTALDKNSESGLISWRLTFYIELTFHSPSSALLLSEPTPRAGECKMSGGELKVSRKFRCSRCKDGHIVIFYYIMRLLKEELTLYRFYTASIMLLYQRYAIGGLFNSWCCCAVVENGAPEPTRT